MNWTGDLSILTSMIERFYENKYSGMCNLDVCTIFENRKGYGSEIMHLWPDVGNANMRLKTIQFFNFSQNMNFETTLENHVKVLLPLYK